MRLFVALDLPDSMKRRLGALCGGLAGVRWHPVASMHLTLRFIGTVDHLRADDIDAALSAVHAPMLPLALAGTGLFAHGGMHGGAQGGHSMLWAGVEGGAPLEHLRHKIDNALRRAGCPVDRRRFQPHVTLARVDGIADALLGRWMAANNLFRTPPATLDRFTLFSSHLGQDQPCYVPEADYPLG